MEISVLNIYTFLDVLCFKLFQGLSCGAADFVLLLSY